MSRSLLCLVPLVVSALLFPAAARAEQHRATRLGHPATRFAPPLNTPEDLRARFRDQKLRADIASILQQWGWKGELSDLYQAAASAKIADVKIPVGTVMPFMSSRENGRAICLRNVLWAGNEPAPAYAFQFVAKGQRYRCVTPKACSNFFLEDLGPEPKFGLAMECSAPAEVLAGRPVEVCLVLRNTGNQPEAKATLALAVPQGAKVFRITEGGVVSDTQVTWEVSDLAPGASQRRCAFFGMRALGMLSFSATAQGMKAGPAESTCSTRIQGVPAILVELVDLEDPVEVQNEVTYEIRVTNQGSAPGTNIRLTCHLPSSEEYISGSGATAMKADKGVIRTEALPELAAKAVATWRVVVRAVQADDARFKLQLSSDQFQHPIDEEESTQLY
jgi:uncharacterized repeat protein (TIGR01451 family)